MSEPTDQNLLKTAGLIAQTVASTTGADLSSLHHVGRRTPEHIAEVARLERKHSEMLAEIDRYADSRCNGYGDKSYELVLDRLSQIPTETPSSLSQSDKKSE